MSEQDRQPRRVKLRIGELVLHGFPAADRYRIADALERELSRLLAEQDAAGGLSKHHGAAELDAGTYAAPANASPEAVGAQIAQAVHRALR